MSDSFTGLTQLLKLNNANAIDVGAKNIFNSAPALSKLISTESSNGAKHIHLVYSTAPTGGFRAINDGIENSVSLDTEVTVDLKVADYSWQEDVRVARAYNKGVDAFMARESQRHLQAMLAALETQVFYGTGTGGSSSGFAGLANDTRYDSVADTQVVDATGSTATTGSSCWLIRSVNDLTDLVFVVKDGNIEIEDYYQTTAAGSTTGRYDVYRQPIHGMFGLQIGSNRSVVRIGNLTAQSGKGLTDTLIATGMSKFPSDAQPNMIVCNSRSLAQLRASRTATNLAGTPAPFPVDAFNIPIILTDNILNNEAILT